MASKELMDAIKALLGSVQHDELRSGGLISRETMRLAYCLALVASMEPPEPELTIAPDKAKNGEHPPP